MNLPPSPTSNPSVLLLAPGKATISDLPIPTHQNPTDVIVHIAFTGVCGSDVHFWRDGGHGVKVSPGNPVVMGHEASGTIHAVGAAVSDVAVGDRVAIEPGYPCRSCAKCKAGAYNLCPDMRFAASPVEPGGGMIALNGTLARFFVIPGDFVYKLPQHVSLEEGVMVEPLAVAVHSVRTVGVKAGDAVVVFGAGTVGLFCAAVAREFGAQKIISVDISAKKLDFVKKWATGQDIQPYNSGGGESAAEIAAAIIKEHDLGLGADVVIEASGATAAIHAGIAVLQKGGSYIQTGLGRERIDFPMMEMCEKEITMKGHFRYGPGAFNLAVGLLGKGRIEVKSLISKVFDFERAPEAWEATGRGEGVKNLIRGVRD